MTGRRVFGMVFALGIALAACTSPEATRTRAGGPGGDIGNRTPIVETREGSRPYWKTPSRLAKDVGMDEAPAASPAKTTP